MANSAPVGVGGIISDYSRLSPLLASFMGLSSVFGALGMVSQTYLGSSIKLLALGSVIETGRRLFQWLTVRLRLQYSVTAQFHIGDPTYEWMILFLTQEGIWRSSCDFVVNATNSRRKWSVKTWKDPKIQGNAEYVPTYAQPQLFRWRGYWVEIRRNKEVGPPNIFGHSKGTVSLYVTIYTLDMGVISELVEDARMRYVDVNRPNVVIHIADSPNHSPVLVWNTVKHKIRRPLSSVILKDGVVDALVSDARDFLASEDWYTEAGIPHRRGYLLHGPPGTGKTSTIYSLAGELNLEIYSLSLASNFVDDAYLQRAASFLPKHALFLIEDIDCAFASREDEDNVPTRPSAVNAMGPPGIPFAAPRSQITLSGLLNVIDGVGSEEGKLFFATTNYIDRLDPALLRPGRIDRKVAYELSTAGQAHALFLRFFPEARFPDFAELPPPASDAETSKMSEASLLDSSTPVTAPRETIQTLAAAFARAIPPGQFSTADLQCYLQAHRTAPAAAVAGVRAWVEEQEEERRAREAREAARARAKTGVQHVDAALQVPDTARNNGTESPAQSEFSAYVDASLPPVEN